MHSDREESGGRRRSGEKRWGVSASCVQSLSLGGVMATLQCDVLSAAKLYVFFFFKILFILCF